MKSFEESTIVVEGQDAYAMYGSEYTNKIVIVDSEKNDIVLVLNGDTTYSQVQAIIQRINSIQEEAFTEGRKHQANLINESLNYGKS